jgi:hypothetical protein
MVLCLVYSASVVIFLGVYLRRYIGLYTEHKGPLKLEALFQCIGYTCRGLRPHTRPVPALATMAHLTILPQFDSADDITV